MKTLLPAGGMCANMINSRRCLGQSLFEMGCMKRRQAGNNENMKRKNFLMILTAVLLTALLYAGWTAAAERQRQKEEAAWLKEKLYFDTLAFDVQAPEGAGDSFAEGIKGFRDWAENRIYVFLPSYAEQRTLRVTWRFADELLMDGKKLKNGGTLKNIAYNRAYFLEFRKGGEGKETCTAVFLCSQNLPAAFVKTQSGSMETVNADRENREEGVFCLMDPGGRAVCIHPLSYIKGRGNSTWAQEKKPYSLKLKDPCDILGMGRALRWELLANAYDGSHMRNALVFQMARKAGLAGTPQAAWVDLYLNGEYQGLYQIAEKVEAAGGRLALADQEKGQGDLTGGYLFMMEDAGRYEDAVSKFQTRGNQTLVLKSPGNADEAQLSYISGLVQEFEDALTAKDGINPQTGKSFLEYIDMDSFVKKYLVEEITKNSDAVTNSQYFYKQPDSVSPLLFAGPVWDYDNALGHTDEEAMDPAGLMLDKVRPEGASNLWYGTLCEQPDFESRVREVYREVFSPLLAELSEEKIEDYRKLLRIPASLDWIRWKNTDKSFRYKECSSYDEYVDYLQDFIRRRKEFLDSLYIGQEVWHRVRFVRGYPFGYEDLYVREGDSGRQPPDSSDILWEGKRITGWFYEDGSEYDPERILKEDVTVYARWERTEEETDE